MRQWPRHPTSNSTRPGLAAENPTPGATLRGCTSVDVEFVNHGIDLRQWRNPHRDTHAPAAP